MNTHWQTNRPGGAPRPNRGRSTLALLLSASLALAAGRAAADSLRLLRGGPGGSVEQASSVHPLDFVVVQGAASGRVEVYDADGRLYFTADAAAEVPFRAGGALGTQLVLVRSRSGDVVGRSQFLLDAATTIDDGGKYRDMFRMLRSGMNAYAPNGVQAWEWNGRTYHMFVNWVLDNYHTGKGMRYFSAAMHDMVDMMGAAQREDGMIWSNLNPGDAVAYYKTAYGPFGYVRKIGDRYFVRQPAENHPEYCYVSTIYQDWKANGDDPWVKATLPSAMRALDYCVTDRARWSARFKLLKRVYTIDSWDFQVDDQYTPKIGLTDTMLIDPDKSKFGVFFGDNVYYAASCGELAEMLRHSGEPGMAERYEERGAGIRTRLDALSWNGRFFTHFIDEDPTVHRDLGVDTSTQVAQGNAYALNRGVTHSQAVAIIHTYLDLKAHLPVGSPGEWYSIYPPFRKGFGKHDAIWQYMNGGVGGHVAGELARGAFSNGFEAYGRDILDRLDALGRAHGNKIYFAYTGSIPPPPPAPNYTEVDLGPLANMDTWDQGGPKAEHWMGMEKKGDDIRGLPVGRQTFAGIPFEVADPARNDRRAVVAVSHRAGLPAAVDIPVGQLAGSLYLLHTSTKPVSEGVCGAVTFLYADGTRHVQYIIMGKQLTYWWFPEFKTPSGGVAWHGPSPVSDDVGLSWCAVDNPYPEKKISAVRLSAPEDDGIYVVAGLTLADRPHYVAPDPVSFGGPDNWAAATAMDALVEGLAGVTDGPLSQALSHPVVAPRWDSSSDFGVAVCVRYPASRGYVAYRLEDAGSSRQISETLTTGGSGIDARILLPAGVSAPTKVLLDNAPVAYSTERVESSTYVDIPVPSPSVATVTVRY
jgi:hypothetical protein